MTPEVASYLKSLVLEKLRAHDFTSEVLMTEALTQLSRIIHPPTANSTTDVKSEDSVSRKSDLSDYEEPLTPIAERS